jgi:hypothetical protein
MQAASAGRTSSCFELLRADVEQQAVSANRLSVHRAAGRISEQALDGCRISWQDVEQAHDAEQRFATRNGSASPKVRRSQWVRKS